MVASHRSSTRIYGISVDENVESRDARPRSCHIINLPHLLNRHVHHRQGEKGAHCCPQHTVITNDNLKPNESSHSALSLGFRGRQVFFYPYLGDPRSHQLIPIHFLTGSRGGDHLVHREGLGRARRNRPWSVNPISAHQNVLDELIG